VVDGGVVGFSVLVLAGVVGFELGVGVGAGVAVGVGALVATGVGVVLTGAGFGGGMAMAGSPYSATTMVSGPLFWKFVELAMPKPTSL
jgi:hypothetical protein